MHDTASPGSTPRAVASASTAPAAAALATCPCCTAAPPVRARFTLLSDLYVVKTVKDTAAEAGQPPEVVGTLAGHSLRAGLATAAEAAGVARDVISRILGHHTGVTGRYLRHTSDGAANRPCTSMHSRLCGLAEMAASMKAEAAFAWTNRNVSEAHTLVRDVRTDFWPAYMCTSSAFPTPTVTLRGPTATRTMLRSVTAQGLGCTPVHS
ncbi:hypothetical protein AB0G03_04535 [Micromonospora aurantiaca]|uniref:hypothetical protein n=1 Tax=Micromonospora aurantiaca (nom. illeg.) TaxID=47850 RepID=UPI00340AD808